MQFIRAGVSSGVHTLGQTLIESLEQKKKVLWLVSGGSNISLSVEVMESISAPLTKQLTIMLTDERYGLVGHKNSNAQQLREKGFDLKAASFKLVLHGAPPDETVAEYNRVAVKQFSAADTIIAQLGIGADGHTAGILPHSPATKNNDYASGYEADDFGYRITLTFSALLQVTIAFAFAYGASKQNALQLLRDSSQSLEVQPAQILKAIPKAYVYNDRLGEESGK